MGWKNGSDRRDLYQEVTDKIVAALEAGTAPWVKPWAGTAGGTGGPPVNGVTGRRYTGINFVLGSLGCWGDARFYTFKQAHESGGHVRAGEKGTMMVFFKPSSGTYTAKEKNDAGQDEDVTRRKPPVLKHFYVWNRAQIDWEGEEPPVAVPDAVPNDNPFHLAAELFAASGARLQHGGDRAFYSLGTDGITMPPQTAFVDAGAYYATLLHELTHWTGHPSRCARTFGARFGDSAYAVEELVAELGSAMLCGLTAVDGKLQHAEYLQSWLRVLKADKYAIFTASREAQKAAEYVIPKASGAEGEDGAEGEEAAA